MSIWNLCYKLFLDWIAIQLFLTDGFETSAFLNEKNDLGERAKEDAQKNDNSITHNYTLEINFQLMHFRLSIGSIQFIN